MREFEKWDKQNKLNYATISFPLPQPQSHTHGSKELDVKNERRKGWKAGLEWALNCGGQGIIVDDDDIEHDIVLTSTIQKELEIE